MLQTNWQGLYHCIKGSKLLGQLRKKHLRKQVLFSTKFACGEWNLASPSEIAPLWNICFANVKRRLSFHIERSEIFHNFPKKIISHSATPNISLNSRVAFFCCEITVDRNCARLAAPGQRRFRFRLAEMTAFSRQENSWFDAIASNLSSPENSVLLRIVP